jgi:hypothetical protein
MQAPPRTRAFVRSAVPTTLVTPDHRPTRHGIAAGIRHAAGRVCLALLALAVCSTPVFAQSQMTIQPSPVILTVGQVTGLRAVDQEQRVVSDVKWSSSATTVATVDAAGNVTGRASGQATVTAQRRNIKAHVLVTVQAVQQTAPPAPTALPPSAQGIWIGQAELDLLPTSGTSWTEVLAAADAAWTVQSIEVQSSHVFHQQAMAGALVYARLAPDRSADPYRAKVAMAIRHVMAAPFDPDASVTAPSRNLGAWAINADLIGLASYDPALDAQFREWLRAKLDQVYTSSPATIRTSVWRPNNIGAWSRFAVVACARYLGDTATLQLMARAMRRWLGDTSITDAPFLWYGDQTWHLTPSNAATNVGINPLGAGKDGHHFDGILPEDQNRGTPAAYDPWNFPNDVSSVRYSEVALSASIGTVLMLQRAGYSDLPDASDQALLRAARWIKYAADTFPSKGYRYFTDSREAARPLITFLYPTAGLPDTRERGQFAGREFGFAWTYWTHGH